MPRSTYVLGINAAYHESAACLLRDGELLFALEEERFTRVRHAKRPHPFSAWELPFHAIEHCLTRENITLSDVAAVAYSFQPYVRLGYMLPRAVRQLPRYGLEPFSRELRLFGDIRNAPRLLASGAPWHLLRPFLSIHPRALYRFRWLPHHLCHAASAFFVSPFDEAAVLSVDGVGERSCTWLGMGRGTTLQRLYSCNYPNSLGFLYEEVTRYLGFQRNNDEYKVMALAALGSPTYRNTFSSLVQFLPRGRIHVQIDFDRPCVIAARELTDAFGPPRMFGEPLSEPHADIAASLQVTLEEALLHITRFAREATGADFLCLAGGVALNCVANTRIAKESGFRDIFIQPAANDAGTALGAALLVGMREHGWPPARPWGHCYYGDAYSNDDIFKVLVGSGLRFELVADPAAVGARLLGEERIIGWFQGRAEFGPRALGNRSILASPLCRGTVERVNHIKGREQFRPLAPAVLLEHVADFFEDGAALPYMLQVRRVRPDRRQGIPAVAHCDGTARVQTVSEQVNPLFHRLIACFARVRGVPIVLNTSFNGPGEPIVRTPAEALATLMRTPLDALIIGEYLVTKNGTR
ncbi:MAG: carbamoyltransferase C-terminal domain-containing protein [Planctomycetota bacterium]